MIGKNIYLLLLFPSLFSHSVMSDSLQPHGLQHARLPCLSPYPGGCLNSCPLSQWYYPTILSSVIPSSSCLWFFSASGSFLMSCLFETGGLSFGVSASTSVLMNIQDWFPLGLTGFDLCVIQGTVKSLLQHHSSKASILWHSCALLWSLIPKIRPLPLQGEVSMVTRIATI